MKINYINYAPRESQEINLLQLLEDSLIANHDFTIVKKIIITTKLHIT